ncbi:TetR/AcrR family transcriptional regulator [Patulibacter defluvii]|uniref:TetR/AcrR family transcriptional regulator n=1 Tax=Patulibacter defluvii TaxID=3095358 RepID=UPI002A760672|nr:TetR family transcriptional regulator [Patulibacter sp. DM4]
MRRGAGREALCRALVAVVARDGLDGVTFRAVAREAGVTAGLASYHFGDRDTMVREALQWAAEHSTSVSRIAPEVDDPAAFASSLPELMERFPEEAMFSYELVLAAARRPQLAPDVRRSYDGFIAAVRDSLDRFGVEGDPALANVVFAAIDGLSLQYLLYGDIEATRAGVAALQRLVLRASGDD